MCVLSTTLAANQPRKLKCWARVGDGVNDWRHGERAQFGPEFEGLGNGAFRLRRIAWV